MNLDFLEASILEFPAKNFGEENSENSKIAGFGKLSIALTLTLNYLPSQL